jgi:outer membrane protein assembly factor BamC
VKLVLKLALLGLPLALVACSTLDGDKVDYKSTKAPRCRSARRRSCRANALCHAGRHGRATGFQNVRQSGSQNTWHGHAGMRVEGNGAPLAGGGAAAGDALPLLAFWQETGFKLNLEDARLGLMETD